MAGTEARAIERLGVADAAAGLALSDEVGWNQALADWRLFLSSGVVYGIRARDEIIATAALLPLAPITWMSLVIVSSAHRRQGLAQTLMAHCLADAQGRGLQPYLDATPAGANVYAPMGFVATGLSLQRLRRPGSEHRDVVPPTGRAGALDHFIAMDAKAFGVRRDSLLRGFAERPGTHCHANTGAVALVRAGRSAQHIGPLLANDSAASTGLLDEILQAYGGPLLIDVSDAHVAVIDMLQRHGFVPERPFSRMRFGADRLYGDMPSLVASAGPEFG